MLNTRLRKLLQCTIFAALLCIFSPISIEIGAIPITLGLFAVLLCGVMLPWKQSALSVLLFLLLSLCGLPVFSKGQSGFVAMTGPAGGYILSYLLVAPLVSVVTQGLPWEKLRILAAILGCILGILVCYSFGTVQFMLITKSNLQHTLTVCVLPFILPDLCKAVLASVLGVSARRVLEKHKQL